LEIRERFDVPWRFAHNGAERQRAEEFDQKKLRDEIFSPIFEAL